jgi:hypothetical protein
MKFYPGTNHAVYFDRVKLPKYNGAVSVLSANGADAGRLLRRRLPDFDITSHVHAALFYKRQRERMAVAWNKTANRAAQVTFGRPFEFTDYKISGIGRDEFSDGFKNRLRKLAHESGDAGVIAAAHWRAAGKRNRMT